MNPPQQNTYWKIHAQIDNWIPHFPRIHSLGSGWANSSDYHVQGKLRSHHSYFIFQYTLSGRGWFKNSRGIYSVPSGSGFLCHASKRDVSYGYPEDGAEPWTFIYVNFYGGNPHLRALTDHYGNVFSLPPNHPNLVWMKNFSRNKRATVSLSISESSRQIHTLLAELLRYKQLELKPSRAEEIINKAEALIASVENGDITVQELASKIGVTRAHLTHSFRAIRDTTPIQMITLQKLHYASALLQEEGWTCGEVAKHLGYKSPGHFTRMFKRVTGMNPTEFKKSLKTNTPKGQP
jgi:AraC-like DNA-binding protein